jgi:hypothetical protein
MMAVNEREIPKYVFEDLLFRRRLERQLKVDCELINRLLREQIELLRIRSELLVNISNAVQRQWKDEELSEPRERLNVEEVPDE